MRVQATTSCCGVFDLIDIFPPAKDKDGKPDFSQHMTQLSNGSYPFVFFAGQVYVYRYAQLAQYIRDNNLGKVHETVPANNPNSKNMIIAYLWEVNWPAMSKFKPVTEKVKDKLVEVGEAIRSMAHPSPSTAPGAVNIAPGYGAPPQGNPLTQVIREMGFAQASMDTLSIPTTDTLSTGVFPGSTSYQDKLRLAREAVRRDHVTNRERRLVSRADRFGPKEVKF